MNKTVIAIRHVHFEDLGTLEPVLQARGYAIRYIDAARDDPSKLDALGADLLVLLGGPIGAFDDEVYPFVVDELALARQRLAHRRPILGVCLGAQLIARAMGAKVEPMRAKEIGFSTLSLTDAGRASPLAALGDVPVLHWHGDRFDIPPGAVRLAGTEACDNQAFAVGRHVLALQCHLEADPQRLEPWLVGHACELAQAGIDPRTLRAHAGAVRTQLPQAARAVFSAWLDGIEADATNAT